MTLDRIAITGLRARGRHGVYEDERAAGQEFLVDATLWVDIAEAAAADDLTKTADYGVIAGRLAQIVAGEPVALIETLASRLAVACLADEAVREVEITVHKPQAPVGVPVSDISITVRRSRELSQLRSTAVPDNGPGRPVVIALGSNLGDRLANLQQGLSALCGAGLDCEAVSAVYQTAPVGGPAQDDFLNAVLLARTSLSPDQLLLRCQRAEDALGRVRTVRWGPRTLDVDIITYGQEVGNEPGLILPHPRAHERAFVLAPWLDVDPAACLPSHGLVRDLLAAVGDDGVRRMPAMRLVLPVEEADISCG